MKTSTTEGPTTTPPHFYSHAQCKKSSGPIELMPPSGPHWLVLDCDVRKKDGSCDPDENKCRRGTYAKYCEFTNTTDFPEGQCIVQGGSNHTHYKIPGTTRTGEDMVNAENKTAFSIHSGYYGNNSNRNWSLNGSTTGAPSANASF
jgi:hypothetical protein